MGIQDISTLLKDKYPDFIDYLEDSPWIHMPFEKYEDMTIDDLKKIKK